LAVYFALLDIRRNRTHLSEQTLTDKKRRRSTKISMCYKRKNKRKDSAKDFKTRE
jgi:hypothetical protein